MDTPQVSVVVPTQGKRDTLRDALRSILAQTLTDFEVVLVDDAPLDQTPVAADPRWRDLRQDRRMRVIPWHRCRGCSAAKQHGLESARAPWVCYLDDDNVMLPGRLARSLELAQKTKAKIGLCGFDVAIAGNRRRRQIRASVFQGDDRLLRTTPDTNVLFHARDVAVAWEPDLTTSDDAVFFHRVVAAHQVEAVPNVAEALVVYQVHDGERANSDPRAIREGQGRLLPIVREIYSASARRLLVRRMLVTRAKFQRGRWGRFWSHAAGLVQAGGRRELRFVINAAGVKWPFTRRWMVR